LLDDLLPGLLWQPGLLGSSAGSAGENFGFPVSDLWLEIGFGGGEHLAAQAAAYPNVGLLGCEPYINGVASLLTHVDDHGLRNVRIFPDDARDLLASLPPAVLGRAFILFPDPWPKARHNRRRIVNPQVLDLLATAMKDGAELRLATDHSDYGRWMLALLSRHPDFEWLAAGPGDWQRRSGDWPPTRYEAKALGGGERCLYLRYHRRPRQKNP
jgi:tRNA (guanine-N7-)-methyltransferase